MPDFDLFSGPVKANFDRMAEGELYRTDAQGIFETYLDAFPEGTNEIFRERREYDCACCKHFVRRVGSLVSLDDDGNMVSVWDGLELVSPFAEVATAMREIVANASITGIFRTKENQYGTETNNERTESGEILRWKHFHSGQIPEQFRNEQPGTELGNAQSSRDVLHRGLEELDLASLETVLELIDSKSIYRGEEHRNAVADFIELKKAYEAAPTNFAWKHHGHWNARFKNTVIGTLVSDMSAGEHVVDAVKKFESKVAPANYKRPKALITPTMIKQAMETLRELDLESAVERRFAKAEDISVQDVLWTDGSVRPLMKGGIEGLLMEAAETTCLLYTSPSPRDRQKSRMPSSA